MVCIHRQDSHWIEYYYRALQPYLYKRGSGSSWSILRQAPPPLEDPLSPEVAGKDHVVFSGHEPELLLHLLRDVRVRRGGYLAA